MLLKNRIINHKLELPLLLSAGGMFDVLVAPLPPSSGFDSAIEYGINCIELTGRNDRLDSLEKTGAFSDIFTFNDEVLIPEEEPLPMYELDDVQQGEAEKSERALNEEGRRVDRYQRECDFNGENVVTSYHVHTTQTYTGRLVETLHAANGPPGRKGVTGEFASHASPGSNESTLRLNPTDSAHASQSSKNTY